MSKVLLSFFVSCMLRNAWSFSYFAYGSNMDPSTMESLRNLRPLSAQAGVLVDYKLLFNMPGMPLLEPSAASIRKEPGYVVHGVIYELSDADFATVGRTEGVPFAYQWEQCQVIPYVGDSLRAGETALTAANVTEAVSCYALVATNGRAQRIDHIPPSSSYLRILQDGAAYWKMDRSYQIELTKVRTAQNLLIRDGLSGKLLCAAKLINPSLSGSR
jgi:hypothetical protein